MTHFIGVPADVRFECDAENEQEARKFFRRKLMEYLQSVTDEDLFEIWEEPSEGNTEKA